MKNSRTKRCGCFGGRKIAALTPTEWLRWEQGVYYLFRVMLMVSP